MAIPFKYNFRNLFRRKLRTFLTITGIALVIAASVIMLAFSRGLLDSIRNNGDPDNLMVISKKAMDRVFSSIKKGKFEIMSGVIMDRVAMHVDADELETDLVAPFIHHTATMRNPGPGNPIIEAIIIGVDTERAAFMFNNFRMTGGKDLLDCEEENDGKVAMVGALTYARLGLPKEDLAIGKSLEFNNASWKIVGTFTAPGSSHESEIWVPLDVLATHLNRTDFSYGVVKAKDTAELPSLINEIQTSEQMDFRAVSEEEFFAGHAETFNIFVYIALALSGIIIVGGVLAGMNTMYTAVQGRIREFGMLQVLGFAKGAIIWALLIESLIISLLGGIAGCALGYLINGIPMQVTMGVFLFKVDGLVIGGALCMAVMIGLVGALLPALRAVRMRMVDAMRYN